jgi:pimeloyl-ACP methyl ester carboxylesterase
VPLVFRALLDERTHASAYSGLRVPTLIMRGQHAPVLTRAIAERLPMLLPAARLAIVEGAGHMGPLTHADSVNPIVVRHIAEADAAA